ncbi:hypothetical protein TSAR_014900 [Trichomalopsis sarcophagae]|uniref:Uncharacterized protein n=1 Tax=Trichomalopsis sarcophagae TaxID=543379 RepID=A0A232F7F4_9HYME|nr:hypothetical protein TSAR_014900 [Trichomalopsis sarcophagae]
MGIETVEPTCEARLRHVKRGERRVAEMECRVRTLREKLCRLEKLLPQKDFVERAKLDCAANDKAEYKRETDDAANVCPIDEIARKEKFLRKQIYDMECTEKDYMRQIADAKNKAVTEEPKTSSTTKCGTTPRKNREEIAKERLSLLESYSQRLSSNLQTLEKNHVGLTQESRRLSQVLDETRKDCFEKQEVKKDTSPCGKRETKPDSPKKIEQNVECSCKVLPKCDSCIVCSCDEWERDLETTNEEEEPVKKRDSAKKTIVSTKRTPRTKEKCTCYEDAASSSSDSDGPCECQKVQCKPVKKVNCCDYEDVDVESLSSNDSSDIQTFYSEQSKYTCFCSRNHSHEELTLESDNNFVPNGTMYPKSRKIERIRGGRDIAREKSTALSVQRTQKLSAAFPPVQNSIVDQLKVTIRYNYFNESCNSSVYNSQKQIVKVDELREGLERLKIRNRNLKDFLHSLENPMNLFSKPSEVFSTTCTEVSSSYTLDLVGQSHSGLLSVVKVLEDKCRSKDAIIVALADELKTNASKKLRLRGKELTNDRTNIWKSLSKKKNGRRFTKKDSAIGFLVFLLILVSHVKRSEMISYLSAVKKILTESPFRLITFINESEKISADYVSAIQSRFSVLTKRFVTSASFSWRRMQIWLSELLNLTVILADSIYVQLNAHMLTVAEFLVANQVYIVSTSCFVYTVWLVIKFRKYVTNRARNFSFTPIYRFSNFHKSVLTAYTEILRMIKERLLSSRIFWLILGFCGHMLWSLVSADIIGLIYAYYPRNEEELDQQTLQLSEVVDAASCECDLYHQLVNYSWLFSTMCSKLQTFIEFTSYVLQNFLCDEAAVI